MTNGGEVSGKNFLMKETFEYAKERVANRVENETSPRTDVQLLADLLVIQPAV